MLTTNSYMVAVHSNAISAPICFPDMYIWKVSTLISLINVEVGINVEGVIFWKKLVHNANKRGVEGGKSKKSINV